MLKFALVESPFAKGKIKVYHLVIDNVDQFEAFEDSIEGKYICKINSITSSHTYLKDSIKPLPAHRRTKHRHKTQQNTVELRERDLGHF